MQLRTALLYITTLAACGSESSSNTRVDASAQGSVDGATAGSSDGSVAAGDPANDGAFAVTSQTESIPGAAQGRSLAATIFEPTGAPSPRPLVIVSPGFQLSRTQYVSYSEHLASWGFVVILTDYDAGAIFPDHEEIATDVPAVVTWALAESALAIDSTRIATAGHSLGGKTSIYAAAKDSRIKAVVAWDPVDSDDPSVAPEEMSGMTAAIAVLGETTDGGTGMVCAPTAENFDKFYAAAPSPSMMVTIAGADHMDWVDDPTCFFCGFCNEGTASAELTRKVTRRVNVAWLRLHLDDDTTMNTWLDAPPEAAQLTLARR